MLFSAFDQPDERFCVAQSADHGRVDGPAADLNGEFLDPLQAADAGVADLLERRIGALCQTAEGCFCDAAAGAEDHAAAGADGERGVGGRGLQICKLDPQLPDHGGQLLGGEDGIDVRLPVSDEFLPLGLHLLCRTRHDGHVEGLQAAFLVGGLIVFL